MSDLGALATNWQLGVGNPLGKGSLEAAIASVGLGNLATVPEPCAAAGACLMFVHALARREARLATINVEPGERATDGLRSRSILSAGMLVRTLIPPGGHAAVHRQHDAGDPARTLFVGEKEYGLGDVGGVPFRPSGWKALNDANCSRVMIASNNGVSTTAGAMAFTRIRSGANSMARFPVNA